MRDYLRADVEVDDDDVEHYGILRKSGRYPWGSGGDEVTRSRDFISYKNELLRKGLTPAEIAAGLSTEDHPFNTTMLREATTIARNAVKAADIAQAESLKAKGYKTTKIAEMMDRNESSIRALLKPGEQEKLNVLHRVVDFLRDQVEKFGAIDIGRGNEHNININVARNKLDTAVSILRDENYVFHKIQVPQATGLGKTTVKVLAKPEFEGREGYRRLRDNPDLVKTIDGWSEDGGRSFSVIKPPLPLSPSRLAIRYKEDGGDQADGLILVREGVPDISLGKSRYAQVRIQVGKGHYIKGMAMYSDDIPDGADIVFNVPKSRKEIPNKLDALKPLKLDKETGEVDKLNPFGSLVRQIGDREYPNGPIKKVTSVMNLVNEQGDWREWQDSLSSQMLSKQRSTLAQRQLDLAYKRREEDLQEILALSNPAVRKTLLEKFADEADSAAVEMKAHALPGQSNHVILPIADMNPTEIYAPNFDQGSRVVLIRHPHGGKFEIPELVVNNNHRTAKRLLGQAPDAVGINHEVAKKLSGADFDGDTVLVIPNNKGEIATKSALQDLKDFEPREVYKPYEGMRTVDGGIYREALGKPEYGPKGPTNHMQRQMGDISNLITDMTIRGANDAELARAVRHSMVVIDSQKHHLNYKLSAERNGIKALQEKYQKPYTLKGNAAASTLISRAGGDVTVPDAGRAKVDPVTGRKVYGDPKTWVDSNGNLHTKMRKSVRLRETEDAHELSSGTRIETVYANHSNRLKALANTARKEWYHTPNVEKNPSAARQYKDQVDSLVAKLKEAQSNAPKERQAQILTETAMKARKADNPYMDAAEEKKTKGLLIQEMRDRVGAKRTPVKIEDDEWAAIQAGAISNSMLTEILKNADLKTVRELATPRARTVMTTVKKQSARNLLAMGRTQAEVAQILGVSLSTLQNYLNEE